jgi:parallel beta-helix repeat protein
VTIHGPGAELLTIDAARSDPTPDSTLDDGINENDGDGTIAFVVGDTDYEDRLAVEISGLTITGGDATSAGAISSSENLRLIDVAIVDNSAQQGGGVYQSGGTLTVIDSVISHNNTRKHGGGIFVFGGSLAVVGSVISNNTTRDGFGMGGGIAVDNSNVTSDPDDFVRIERSVISQNSAKGTFAPGGISISGSANTGNPIDVLISGSPISENTASGNVAGIYLYGASATIEDSTVSSNRYVPRAGVGGVLDLPGGIYLIDGNLTLDQSTVVDNLGRRPPFSNPLGSGVHVESGATLHLDHSIVARNGWTAGPGNPVDVVVEFGTAAASSSLIGAAAGVVDEGGSLIGTAAEPIDPMLGPLRYNGGPVFVDGTRMLTHAPLSGSTVIDAGDPAAVAGMNGVPQFDQRGGPWSRVVSGRIDMGAVESQPNPLSGDYNFNGVVDAADYSVWRDTVGSTNDLRADGSSATAPGVPDGVVDEQDYAWWKANFGNVLELGAGSTELGGRNAEAGVQNGGMALAGELRLADVGEDRGDAQENFVPLATELTLQALPARRSSTSIANLRSGHAAGIDAALAAWVKLQCRQSHVDSSDSKTANDLNASELECCDCEPLDLVFAGLHCGW